ncbi:hypothetical protein D3C72_1654870 [compost metagenome]
MGQVQFFRRAHEALVARGSLEKADPAQPVHRDFQSVFLTYLREYISVVAPGRGTQNWVRFAAPAQSGGGDLPSTTT